MNKYRNISLTIASQKKKICAALSRPTLFLKTWKKSFFLYKRILTVQRDYVLQLSTPYSTKTCLQHKQRTSVAFM